MLLATACVGTLMPMSTLKLLGLAAAWAFASVAIAVLFAVVLAELLDVIGLVESGQESYSWALDGIALVTFLLLLAVPFFLRRRLGGEDE